MDNIFYRMLLNDKIKIEPKFLSKNYRSYLLEKLKANCEGKCSKHGYIKNESIELYKVAPGSIELIGLNGNIVFEVYFYADVCNPLVGNVVMAKVANVNKFGILGEVSNILEIIIPKTSVNISHEVDDLSHINIGDTIMVEVVGKKYELNDKKISIVGRVVTGGVVPAAHAKPVAKVPLVAADDDEEFIEVIEGGGSVEESEDEEEEEDIDEDIDEQDDDVVKAGNEFFDSDEEVEGDGYEFFSDEEDASVNDSEGEDNDYE